MDIQGYMKMIRIQQVNLSDGFLFTIYVEGEGSSEVYKGELYTYRNDISINREDDRLIFNYEVE